MLVEEVMCGAECVNSCINRVILHKQRPAVGQRGVGLADARQTSVYIVSKVFDNIKRLLNGPCCCCWSECVLTYLCDCNDTGSRESGSAVNTPRSTEEG